MRGPSCARRATSGSAAVPFHEERSPSFSVNAGKKLYYCFGCGAKGDVIDFVRADRGGRLRRRDRVARRRATASSSSTSRTSPVEEARRRRDDRLRTLLDETARWYARRLQRGPAGGGGARVPRRTRARRRGDRALRRRPRARRAGTASSRAAQGRGYTVDELEAAGLAVRSQRTRQPDRPLPRAAHVPRRRRARPRGRVRRARRCRARTTSAST